MSVSTFQWSKFDQPTRKRARVHDCFSQSSLYPKTKPRVSHPLLEYGGLVNRKTDNELPNSNLSVFFPAESLSVRQSRHRIGSIYFHFMAVENINRRILLESLTHRFLPSISHADRKRKAYRRRLNENNFVLDGRLGEV